MIKTVLFASCVLGSTIAMHHTTGTQQTNVNPPLAPVHQTTLPPVPWLYSPNIQERPHPAYTTPATYDPEQPELYKCATGIIHCGQPMI